ncbi:MAG: hypothetical protein IPJ77_22050 [Planctomycetes bacterium]|nr:hypothetical protein [Planctomycetota bacterium]
MGCFALRASIARAGFSLVAAVFALVLPLDAAQKAKSDVCPWCKNDPELMKNAGIVSHGPMPIGPKGSEEIVAKLPAAQWVFLETAHLRWASSLGPCNVELEDKKRVMAELARLKQVLPTVPDELKKLDPFLRLHLFAMKGEEFYARFQKLLAVTDADFPESRQATGPYMGNGRFLGEKDKFEVVIHSTRANHRLFVVDFAGTAPTDALRWHLKDEHKMIASVPAEDPDLKKDKLLFPHVVHNLSHLFFDAYKHFSYDPPLWLTEGLALCMEKEIEPTSTTNEGEEGGKSDVRGPRDWNAAVKKLVAAGKQKRLAQLLPMKEVSELDEESKLTAWSMVRFLLDAHPEKTAQFLGGVKGQLDAQGIPTGRDLPDLQRKLLKDLWDWNPVTFDEAWTGWVTAPVVTR